VSSKSGQQRKVSYRTEGEENGESSWREVVEQRLQVRQSSRPVSILKTPLPTAAPNEESSEQNENVAEGQKSDLEASKQGTQDSNLDEEQKEDLETGKDDSSKSSTDVSLPDNCLTKKIKNIDPKPKEKKDTRGLGAVNTSLPSMLDVDGSTTTRETPTQLQAETPRDRYSPRYLPERYRRRNSWAGPTVRYYVTPEPYVPSVITDNDERIVDEHGRAIRPDVIAQQSENMSETFSPGSRPQQPPRRS
jgi:hypothetical protein